MFGEFFENLRNRYEDLDFSNEQKRVLLFIFGGFLIIGASFFFLNQGGKAAALPSITVPEIPSVAPIVVIDVAGKVNKPGVYKLPSGSRAIDAITAAGGAKKGVDLSDINLAHTLTDGEQIIVGAPKVVVSSKGKKTSGKVKLSGPLNINTATAAQFDALPGIGPVMAARIITYREKNGPFKAITDLRKVSGMGASKFAQIQDQIRI
jgi:competence protein ComEA